MEMENVISDSSIRSPSINEEDGRNEHINGAPSHVGDAKDNYNGIDPNKISLSQRFIQTLKSTFDTICKFIASLLCCCSRGNENKDSDNIPNVDSSNSSDYSYAEDNDFVTDFDSLGAHTQEKYQERDQGVVLQITEGVKSLVATAQENTPVALGVAQDLAGAAQKSVVSLVATAQDNAPVALGFVQNIASAVINNVPNTFEAVTSVGETIKNTTYAVIDTFENITLKYTSLFEDLDKEKFNFPAIMGLMTIKGGMINEDKFEKELVDQLKKYYTNEEVDDTFVNKKLDKIIELSPSNMYINGECSRDEADNEKEKQDITNRILMGKTFILICSNLSMDITKRTINKDNNH